MKVTLHTRNFDLTEAITEKIENAFYKAVKLSGENARVEVWVERMTNHHKQGEVYKIESKAKLDDKSFFVEEKGEDVYKLADEVSLKLEREIIEYKDRHRDTSRNMRRKMKDVVKQIKFW